MARPPRRTFPELARDLHAILGLPLHEDTRRGLCWKLIWDCTELEGRWKNPRFRWSEAAVAQLRHNQQNGNGWFVGLRREHSYPMSLTIGELIVPGIKLPQVERLLDRGTAIAVLTVKEANVVDRLNKTKWPEGKDPFRDRSARYDVVTDPPITFAQTEAPWATLPASAEQTEVEDPDRVEPRLVPQDGVV